ncbi:MAG: M48 family metalloprotease, partial [Bdellovibrionota bacterium]
LYMRHLLAGLACLTVYACASSPVSQTPKPDELALLDGLMGNHLVLGMKTQVKTVKNPAALNYVQSLVIKLADSHAALRLSKVEVVLIQPVDKKWRNFSLPGNKLYLSAKLLSKAQSESEVAAIIALELGHLVRRHVANRYTEKIRVADGERPLLDRLLPTLSESESMELLAGINYFGADGIFDFTVQDILDSCEDAARLLYNSNYDSRGLASIWKTYSSLPGPSPYEAKMLELLTVKTYEIIASNAPLRNPVVRTEAFLRIQKELSK